MVNKLIIGGRERVKLDQVSKAKILARIDTGAKSSSVHCERYWVENKRGKHVLHAAILNKNNVCTFNEFKIKNVKSSNGISEKRYLVKLEVSIGTHVVEAEFTLSNRKKMKNPVLLGRKFLRGRFLVDVTRNFILSGRKPK
ncbi:MAG TPA: RimK/LysX family protein [Flavobacteriales bacterium]|nr:RimK/LysX family protein [Flavobacteriales bacterium]